MSATGVRRRLAGLAVAAAVVAAGCGGDGGDGPAAEPGTSRAPSTTPPAGDSPLPTTPQVDPIEWSDCGNAECASVDVPLDHDEPEGREITLAVSRLPATGDRIGALFLNFGGPGSPATTLLGSFPVPGAVNERFDLVAVDPRGVGGSTPLDCGLPPSTLYGVDPTVETPADARALIDVSQRYADDCARQQGDLLPHIGTRDVARDMDLVRAAMGEEQLNFIGYSYGTAIGQAYAELFPGRVRTMVLDGVVDPDDSGIELAIEQARGFESALVNWGASCGARPSCHFVDPIDAVERMLAAAEDGVPSSDRRPLGPGEAAVGLALPLYSESLWPILDEAVAAALAGDGSPMVGLADRYQALVEFPVYFAVSCLDSEWPDSPDALLGRAAQAAEVAPRFGEAIVNDYLRCAVWPTDPQPLGAIEAPDAPPILVVSTTGDPATPHENGVAVADRLASGVLLTNEGEGHTIVFQGNPCIDLAVIDYLVDQVTPAEGARC